MTNLDVALAEKELSKNSDCRIFEESIQDKVFTRTFVRAEEGSAFYREVFHMQLSTVE